MGGLKNLFSPGNQMFFFLLAAFAGITAVFSVPAAAAEAAVILFAAVVYRRQVVRRRRNIVRYIDQLTANVDVATKNSVINCPIPMLILRVENGEMIWANDGFTQVSGLRERMFNHRIGEILPDFDLKWISASGGMTEVNLLGKQFIVYGNFVRVSEREKGELMATLYFIDNTELSELRQKYRLSRLVVSILLIDNYEECLKNMTESQKSAILAAVDEKISTWTTPGILRKYDRDKYLFIFEEREMPGLIEDRFSILDDLRAITGSAGLPVTLSIGIGRDGETLNESFSYAHLAIEMALSRGGDQAVIKNRFTFEFFGGRSNETEKRTKVKSRVVASSLLRFMTDSSMVLVMGHANSDIDSLGAAAGVVCMARKCGKRAHIVVNEKKTLAASLLTKLREQEQYLDVFIDSQMAMILADNKTLLVVVDCNRPEIVEAPDLLNSMNRVAVIDHHRRAATYIENAVLVMHEPYASSASELVTELTQYICQPGDLLRCEAEAMMAGIVLDTKSFTMHTGMRTFEAAAFLRGAGADPVEIKRLFQNDMQSSMERYEIISGARMARDNIAIAVADREVDRAIAAQAADEMLNIAGIDASFVLFRAGDETVMSGRSLGGINVQVVLEKLGGGGHRTIAGAQLPGVAVHDALNRLLGAIDQYCEENSIGNGIPPQAI